MALQWKDFIYTKKVVQLQICNFIFFRKKEHFGCKRDLHIQYMHRNAVYLSTRETKDGQIQ